MVADARIGAARRTCGHSFTLELETTGQSDGMRPPSYLCCHVISLDGCTARSGLPSPGRASVTHAGSRARCRPTASAPRSRVPHGQIAVRVEGSPRRWRASKRHPGGSWLVADLLAPNAALRTITTAAGSIACVAGALRAAAVAS